jgi:hypothetical protein
MVPQRRLSLAPSPWGAVRNKIIVLGWSRGYINARITRLKRVFKWAVGKELIPRQVYQPLDTLDGSLYGHTLARETKPVAPVSDSIVDATLERLSSVVSAMVQVQRLKGARSREFCRMRVGEVDRTGTFGFTRHRSTRIHTRGEDRLIYIGPRAQEFLASFLMKIDPSLQVLFANSY